MLLTLLCVNYLSAYQLLCLTRNQGVPPAPESPVFTCNHDICQICVNDNFYPANANSCSNIASCSPLILDQDNDGVPDNQDKCLNTILPENFAKLEKNHYGDIDGDKIFETLTNKGKVIKDSQYNLTSTYGCSCKQILEFKPGKNKNEEKFGCKKETLDKFIKQIGWAKNLFN